MTVPIPILKSLESFLCSYSSLQFLNLKQSVLLNMNHKVKYGLTDLKVLQLGTILLLTSL